MNTFKDFKDQKYLKLNTSLEVQSLVRKIYQDSSNGPLVTDDMSEMIYQHCRYLTVKSNIDDVRKLVNDAIRFFNKGKEDEVLESLLKKIKERVK